MIIVTGGAGFIGSNIINALNKKGINDIIIVDNIAFSSKYLNISSLNFYDYINKSDFLSLLPKLKNVDLIIHQGACSSTTETDGNYMIKNNYEYSKEILNHAITHKIKFIYASSASVYGDGEKGFSEDPLCESPKNVYAFSKVLFDNYVRKTLIKNKYSAPITGLRYFNVFGYQENHKGSMASVPFHFFQQIKKGRKVKLFEGSNNYLRDFIFIEDIVKIINFFIENSISGIFNCGTGKARSFLDIAKIIKSYYKDIEIEYIPFPAHLIGKYQKYTKANISKLRMAGYDNSFLSLEESIKIYLNRLENNNGYL